MDITEATRRYEQWVRSEVGLVRPDIERKHEEMDTGAFQFFRATYYRWAQTWGTGAGKLAETPGVLSVGDLHAENFGTWRDAEGRLVWGINDFDEAAELPLASDLTRLAVSALLAVEGHGARIPRGRIAETILGGYQEGVASGGRPFVLEERHPTLRAIAQNRLKDAAPFWKKLDDLPPFEGKQPKAARRLLAELLPRRVTSVRIVRRVAGIGSLGRLRVTAIGDLAGGHVAREVKQLTAPASYWATGRGPRRIQYAKILSRAVRCQDPFLVHSGAWIGRRLSPSNSRIDLADLPMNVEVEQVLHGMGFETANVHLGHGHAKRLKKAVRAIKLSEFVAALRALEDAVHRDWNDWRDR